MTILKILAIIILSVLAIALLSGFILSEKGHKGEITDHFNGKTFINPSGIPSNGLPEVFKYMTSREAEKWTENYESYVRSEPLPDGQPDKINITFVNHSTFIIQYEDITVVTDPIWSKRCSPTQLIGPKRMRPPGVNYEDLKDVDLVIISHNHYDHLDENTIKSLIRDFDPLFIVPLGVEHIISNFGSSKVKSLDWWDDLNEKGIKITAVPANHFSSRGGFDRDQTLWAGFVIEYHGHRTYFAGDTGYGDIFKTIGARLGPIDISFIPIGAYLPRWFMSPIHVSPEEAVMIHKDVQSNQSIGMHFGTFALADNGPYTPIHDLYKSLLKSNTAKQDFLVPDEGSSYTYSL